MTQEKTLRVTGGRQKSARTPYNKTTLAERRGLCNSIDVYAQGACLYVMPIIKNGKPQGGQRGEIKGWSTASRRRMREFMLMNRPADGLEVCGVTLTIPGPVMAPGIAKKLFERFALNLHKSGACAVWRLEIQQRGQLHWHLMAGAKRPGDIVLLWHDTIASIGPETFDPPHVVGKMAIDHVTSRMALPGADLRAVHLDKEGSRGSWLRYLQDHCSKGKQEQIAVNIGRHWGVIGRKLFTRVLPDKGIDLDDRQMSRVIRMLQRLATPSEFHPESPFGRRLRGRVRRGSRGKSIWYTNPKTVSRLVNWTLRHD